MEKGASAYLFILVGDTDSAGKCDPVFRSARTQTVPNFSIRSGKDGDAVSPSGSIRQDHQVRSQKRSSLGGTSPSAFSSLSAGIVKTGRCRTVCDDLPVGLPTAASRAG